MPILNELILTVVGGVLTALILERVRGSGNAPTTASAATGRAERPRSGSSFFGQLVRVILAVTGGYFCATTGARYIFQSGILERSPMNRLAILVAGTIVCWLVLAWLFRRR
ncbi:MAG: hypothetical protein GC150_02015 [Rhizobiales bacterium]|nr:hypothetical protein [Hyphomicrobiales bacterium]